VFFHNDEQRREAELYKQKIDESGAFDAPIVTEITKFKEFFPAEDYHQEYFAQNPSQGYCRAVIRPKMEKFRKVFKDKLKGAKPSQDEDSHASRGAIDPREISDPENFDWSEVNWKKRLSPEVFAITRKAGTERPFTGKYWNVFDDGEYQCSNCGLSLFESTSKFDAHCGWPSFDKTLGKDSVTEHADNTLGMRRIEVRCRRCGAHLGHVFDDGPTDTGLRYCMNSASLKFIPADEAVKSAATDKPERGEK
jgi:methionine-R-sulfoxide reductase